MNGFKKSSTLCPELQSKCNDYISSHAELLQAWKMHTKRAEVCKHIHRKSGVHHTAVQEKQCCSVCQLPLTKAIGRCSECGHGMHLEHLVTWFKSRRDCPLCNCACVAFIND
uniref:RING-type domain-containing protein n=1 Tax=Ciona savignyi TaxID=51511 RepID=H2ZGX7_CIOSA